VSALDFTVWSQGTAPSSVYSMGRGDHAALGGCGGEANSSTVGSAMVGVGADGRNRHNSLGASSLELGSHLKTRHSGMAGCRSTRRASNEDCLRFGSLFP
jgi:hypothetical protein